MVPIDTSYIGMTSEKNPTFTPRDSTVRKNTYLAWQFYI